jgi:hypothetical protein
MLVLTSVLSSKRKAQWCVNVAFHICWVGWVDLLAVAHQQQDQA